MFDVPFVLSIRQYSVLKNTHKLRGNKLSLKSLCVAEWVEVRITDATMWYSESGFDFLSRRDLTSHYKLL